MGHKVGGVYLVRVTQLVEYRTVTAEVAGSYPVSYPKKTGSIRCGISAQESRIDKKH